MKAHALGNQSSTADTFARKRLLVVDDDESIRDLISDMLEEDEWDVSGAADGSEALDSLAKEQIELVFLDLKVPDIDGFEVLRRIRRFSSIPIVAISGLTSVEDRESFLNLGGSDYITKPFTTDEVRFRAWAALTRAAKESPAPGMGWPREPPSRFDSDDGQLKIEFAARRVIVQGVELRLTRTEFDLLRELAGNAGKAVSYDDILEAVWGPEYKGDRGRVRDYIDSLRKKIEPDPARPRYINNLPGFGYRFATRR